MAGDGRRVPDCVLDFAAAVFCKQKQTAFIPKSLGRIAVCDPRCHLNYRTHRAGHFYTHASAARLRRTYGAPTAEKFGFSLRLAGVLSHRRGAGLSPSPALLARVPVVLFPVKAIFIHFIFIIVSCFCQRTPRFYCPVSSAASACPASRPLVTASCRVLPWPPTSMSRLPVVRS